MKIIKPGAPEVLEKLNQTFECPFCGCVFVAKKQDYSEDYATYFTRCAVVRIAECPECGEYCRVEVRYD